MIYDLMTYKQRQANKDADACDEGSDGENDSDSDDGDNGELYCLFLLLGGVGLFNFLICLICLICRPIDRLCAYMFVITGIEDIFFLKKKIRHNRSHSL